MIRVIAGTRLPLFFTSSAASQAAGRAFLDRASVRTVDRDPESNKAVSDPQAKALIDWCASKDPENTILNAIDQPVLVVSGSDDTMLPDGNAYFMFKHLKNAQLILYPEPARRVRYPSIPLCGPGREGARGRSLRNFETM